MAYDGFISYSHAADGKLAPAVQSGLQRLARPWYRRRSLNVFRDETGLSVNPHLWSSIRTALDQSSYFVLLASPDSAASPWVNRELSHWLESNPAERILPVLTDGTLIWNAELGDYDPASASLPAALRGRFAEEPKHLDLRWAREETQLDLRHSRFRQAIAGIAAPMHGIPRDDLEGEDVRIHRRALRLAWGAVAMLVLLTLGALTSGALALAYAGQAQAALVRAQNAEARAVQQADIARAAQVDARTQATHAVAAEAGARDELALQQTAERAAETAQAKAHEEADSQRIAESLASRRADEAVAARVAADRSAAAERQAKLAQTAAATRAEIEATRARQEASARAAAEGVAHERASAAISSAVDARQQVMLAKSRELAAESVNNSGPGIDIGLLLASESAALAPTPQSRGALLTALVDQPALDGLLYAPRNETTVRSTTISPDGVLVAATMDDGAVIVWNLQSRRLLDIQPPAQTAPGQVLAAFSPDGRTLGLVNGGTLGLWDAPTGSLRVIPISQDPADFPERLAFSGDGARVAINSGDHLLVVNLASGVVTRLADSTPFFSPSNSPVFSPDGSHLAVGADSATAPRVLYWDLAAPAVAPRVYDPGMSTTGTAGAGLELPLHFSPDGGQIVFASANQDPVIAAIDVASGAVTSSTPASQVQQYVGLLVALSADLRRGVWQDAGARTFRVRDVASGADLTGAISEDLVASWQALMFTPDSSALVGGGADGRLRIWAIRRQPGIAAQIAGPAASGDYVLLSADGRQYALAGTDGAIRLHDLASGAETGNLNPPAGTTYSAFGFAPDGGSFAYLTSDSNGLTGANVVNLRQPGYPTRLHLTPSQLGGLLAFSQDGNRVAIQDSAGTVTIYDLRTGGALSAIPGPQASSLALSPDGAVVAIGDYTGLHVRLYGTADGKALGSQPEPGLSTPQINTLVYSPDGTMLAAEFSVAGGARVQLWHLPDGRAVGSGIPAGAMPGRLAFSPDSSLLAASTFDGAAGQTRLFDVATQQQIGTPLGDTFPGAATVAFSLDGGALLTAPPQSFDGTVVVRYDLNVDHQRAAACAIANRDFTDQERSLYLGDTPDLVDCRR